MSYFNTCLEMLGVCLRDLKATNELGKTDPELVTLAVELTELAMEKATELPKQLRNPDDETLLTFSYSATVEDRLKVMEAVEAILVEVKTAVARTKESEGGALEAIDAMLEFMAAEKSVFKARSELLMDGMDFMDSLQSFATQSEPLSAENIADVESKYASICSRIDTLKEQFGPKAAVKCEQLRQVLNIPVVMLKMKADPQQNTSIENLSALADGLKVMGAVTKQM